MEFLSNLINGISLGSVYAIIALGYTMVYGIAKMLNFAHGDVIMVGGYISFCAIFYLGLPSIVSVILAMISAAVLINLTEKSEGYEKPIIGILTAVLSLISIWTNMGVVETIRIVLGA